jgi:hypothetical protein
MAIVGMVLAVVASRAYWRRTRRFATWRKAKGTIVAIESEHVPGQESGADSTHHSTTVRFNDHRGNEVIAADLSFTHQDHVGRSVSVLYDPMNTTDAEIDDWRKHVVEISGIGFALVCFLIAALTD